MILYGELTKVEPQPDGSIKVFGVASTGARDTAGEVVSPEAMKAALPAYLAFGAIREMHQPSAAGAALSAEVGIDGATRITAHIVDPLAIRKVQAGVYKGLSIGGKVLARDPADASVITRIRLDEISLVDRPCNPEAVIDLWKAAGAAPAPSNDQVRAEAERLAKAAGRPGRRNDFLATAREALMRRAGPPAPVASVETPAARALQHDEGSGPSGGGEGDGLSRSPQLSPEAPAAHEQNKNSADQAPHGSYADPLAAKYPLDTPERIRAAWSSLNAAQNRAGYGPDEIAAMEARIAAAWRAKIDPAGPPSAPPNGKLAAGEDLRKVADLKSALAVAEAEVARLSKLAADAAPELHALNKRLAEQAAEIERLGRAPLPPRTAGSAFAQAVAKHEDAGGPADRPSLSADDFARALEAMAPADRAHLLMKAALARPIPLGG